MMINSSSNNNNNNHLQHWRQGHQDRQDAALWVLFVCFSRVRDGKLLHTGGDLYRTVLRHLSASEVPAMADS